MMCYGNVGIWLFFIQIFNICYGAIYVVNVEIRVNETSNVFDKS